eukprot:TRINITY_DN66655_c4_g3_i1.p1 TRINITY_DN66655_c4_g3~~TRINITY_DN66655_c4_g3_i1.p1  ORF type:complete len:266 (-),score=-22.66 TRINITY_DN66655_c4_g3_i1:174-971(-)
MATNLSGLNTEQKVKIIGIDVFSALLAAGCVSPGIAVVDQAVTEYASDKKVNVFRAAFKNLKSVFTQPKVFFGRPTLLYVAIVYSGTYLTANIISSLCDFYNQNPFWLKLGGTTAANMCLGIWKDRIFAQKFSKGPVTKFPLTSWSIFVFRDLVTIGAGFSFPKMLSDYTYKHKIIKNKNTAEKFAQFAVPMSAQLVITPIHLLSLDFYNNKISTPMKRLHTIGEAFVKSTTLRIFRVLCAYGVAGVVNTGLRRSLREIVINRNV